MILPALMNHSGLFANSEWIRVKPETPLHRQTPLFSSFSSLPHSKSKGGKEACLREPLIAEFLELRVINPQFGRRHNSSFLARFLRAPRVSHCTDTIMDCQRHALESLDNQETIWTRKKSGFDHLSDFGNQKKTPLWWDVQNRMDFPKLAFKYLLYLGLNLIVLGNWD